MNLFDLSTASAVAMTADVRDDYDLWCCLMDLALANSVEAQADAIERLFELLVLRRGMGL